MSNMYTLNGLNHDKLFVFFIVPVKCELASQALDQCCTVRVKHAFKRVRSLVKQGTSRVGSSDSSYKQELCKIQIPDKYCEHCSHDDTLSFAAYIIRENVASKITQMMVNNSNIPVRLYSSFLSTSIKMPQYTNFHLFLCFSSLQISIMWHFFPLQFGFNWVQVSQDRFKMIANCFLLRISIKGVAHDNLGALQW